MFRLLFIFIVVFVAHIVAGFSIVAWGCASSKSWDELDENIYTYSQLFLHSLEEEPEWETLRSWCLFNGFAALHPQLGRLYASPFFNIQYFWYRYLQFSGDVWVELEELWDAWDHFRHGIGTRFNAQFSILVNTNWFEVIFANYIAGFKGWAQRSPLKLRTFLYAVVYSYVRYRLPLTFREFLGLKIAKRTLKITPFSWPFLMPAYIKRLGVQEIRGFFKINYPRYYMQYIYIFFKTTLVALLGGLFFFYYSMLYFSFTFLKQLVIWFVAGMLFLWLISGFNFFVKRYRFGKFTSAIQRFWKRANVCFWVIEGFVFFLFFYYYLNSSQEPLYMYDYSAMNQDHIFNLTTAYFSLVFLAFLIFLTYVLLFGLSYWTFSQSIFLLLLISLGLLYIFYIEVYQFYYLISTFVEIIWTYSADEVAWGVESDSPKLRVKQQYLVVCLVAKYWHFMFIFISWFFFILKSFEVKKITFTLLGANLQNLIILYGLNLLILINWGKWVFRRYYDMLYFWFFTNTNAKYSYTFVEEVSLFISALIICL